MKTKYIFSTKYYGGKNGNVFSGQCHLSDNSKILEFLINKLDDNFWEELINYEEKVNKNFKEKVINLTNSDEKTKDIINNNFIVSVKQNLKQLKKFVALVSEHPRFSYYIPKDVNDRKKCVYAVPCLHGTLKTHYVDWINALILDNTLEEIEEGGTLYLILHDKDVRDFIKEDCKILTVDDINKIGIIGQKQDDKYVVNGCCIRIIVYSHTNNDIVHILKREFLNKKDVAESVQSVIQNDKNKK